MLTVFVGFLGHVGGIPTVDGLRCELGSNERVDGSGPHVDEGQGNKRDDPDYYRFFHLCFLFALC